MPSWVWCWFNPIPPLSSHSIWVGFWWPPSPLSKAPFVWELTWKPLKLSFLLRFLWGCMPSLNKGTYIISKLFFLSRNWSRLSFCSWAPCLELFSVFQLFPTLFTLRSLSLNLFFPPRSTCSPAHLCSTCSTCSTCSSFSVSKGWLQEVPHQALSFSFPPCFCYFLGFSQMVLNVFWFF